MFLLLMTFRLQSGATETDWKLFNRLEEARARLDAVKLASESNKPSLGCPMTMGPVLVKAIIFHDVHVSDLTVGD